MKIALLDSDKTKFPNLALMKISAWHKSQGDNVEKYLDIMSSTYEKVYVSKVFTFNKTDQVRGYVESGGTGIDLKKKLPEVIEHSCPDYDIYETDFSIGFTTRGCIRKCKGCFVPKKEGMIVDHADLEEFIKHRNVLLLDNNILASRHGIKQLEKSIKLNLKLDCNQGLNARLIDIPIAKLLSKIKWFKNIRLACDSPEMIEPVRKAIELLRWYNAKPVRYFVYCLITDIEEATERIKFLKGMDVDPFVQPYRNEEGDEPPKDQKRLARYVNTQPTFRSVWLENDKWQGNKG